MCAFKVKIKGLENLFNQIEKEIDGIVKEVLLRSANTILQEALSRLPADTGAIKASFSIEVTDNGFKTVIFSNEEVAAYIEFGTGDFAKAYLAGKPREVVDEAIKFFVNGKGKMPAKPYLFPAYLAHRDNILIEIDNKIDEYFKSK